MIAIGIDIGITGAIAFVSHTGTCVVVDMPTVPDGDKGRRIAGRGLLDVIRQHAPVGEALLVGFENVRPRHQGNRGFDVNNSMHSQGSMMRTRGAIEAVLDVLGLTAEVFQPTTWQRHFGLRGIGKDETSASRRSTAKKRASLDVARSLYPRAELHLQKHHNRAEAVLIAHYLLTDEGVIES